MNDRQFDLRKLATGFLFGAAFSTAAWAMPPHHGGDFHGGMGADLFHVERMAEKLGLDDSQRQQLEALHERQRELARPHVRALVKARKAMRAATRGDSFDEGAVRTIATAQSTAMIELAVLRQRARFEMRQILTPEQRERMRRRHHGRDGGDD
ncbi:MAG: Spy/CpxP family protein refolding chaperone [Gammaproteobacteria bacterium]